MNQIIDISLLSLAGGYLLLIFPLATMLYLRVGMLKETAVAVLRMTVQLLFVGLYLQVVFQLNNPFLNLAWVAAMILVADLSILKGCRLKLKRFLLPMFIALLSGTLLPMIFFAGIILRPPGWFEAPVRHPVGRHDSGQLPESGYHRAQQFLSVHPHKRKIVSSVTGVRGCIDRSGEPFFPGRA